MTLRVIWLRCASLIRTAVLVALIGCAGCAGGLAELAGSGDLSAVQKRLAKGADPNTASGKDTPLTRALKGGHADVAAALLNADANPSMTDSRGTTPLMIAAARGDIVSLQNLLDRNVNVNAHRKACIKTAPGKFRQTFVGMTALAYAVDSGHVEAVQLLLRAGADPNQKVVRHNAGRNILAEESLDLCADEITMNIRGVGGVLLWDDHEEATPLAIARTRKHEELIRILKAAGAGE